MFLGTKHVTCVSKLEVFGTHFKHLDLPDFYSEYKRQPTNSVLGIIRVTHVNTISDKCFFRLQSTQ